MVYSAFLLFVFLLSLSMTYLSVRFKDRLAIIDTPNERSMHKTPKPRSGGIAIVIAFVIGTLLMFGPSSSSSFLLPLLIVFILGLVDDIMHVSAKVKLLVISLSAALLFYMGYDIQNFGVFLGYEVELYYVVALIFCAVAVGGFVNAVNLIDGLDGLASVISIIILAAFVYIGYKYSDDFLLSVSLLMIFSILGFLVFNWFPSKIFMGDSGSLSIGFVIAVISIYSIKQEYITAISVLLLAAIPILDTLIVMVRRIISGQNPFSPDRTHIHHIILKQQHNDIRKTVFILALMQMFFSYIGLGFKARDDMIILVLYILVFVVFYMLLTPRYKRKYNPKN
ncbi:MAG: glycosyltransferase family 4 protein [Campylobacterales bacterium]